jgi:conjugal transfer pilus assembly protein TraF
MRARPSRAGALLGVGLLVVPAVQAGPANFYGGKAQGWFWYQYSPPPPIEESDPAPPPESPPAPTAPAPQAETPAGPPALSAQWFRENLDRYRDIALDHPTPQNVAVYYYLQRIALDKSSKFAQVAERVVQGDPSLDEITQRPTATFGANLANRQAGVGRDALLESLARTASVWFFFRSDCPYCEAQAPLLEILSKRYGFAVLPISLDGKPLPSGLFPTFQRDVGQGRALGVMSTPALFLVRPEIPAFAPVAQGLLSLAQLQERVVLAAVTAGWISEAEMAKTRPVATSPLSNPNAFFGDVPDDPEAVLTRLRALVNDPSE